MSGTMHVLMLLMKLRIAMKILMMPLVETIKVETRKIKAVECTVRTESRASWEVSASSVIEEAVRTETVLKVCLVSSATSCAVTVAVILSALLLVTQCIVRCSHTTSLSRT